jgi:hypothetical protein
MAGKRKSVYTNINLESPGSHIFWVRDHLLNMSQRDLASECIPPMNHTTIQRIEAGGSYRKDTLDKISATFSRLLDREVTTAMLFLPDEIRGYLLLSREDRKVICKSIEWASRDSDTKVDNLDSSNLTP